MIWMSLFGSTKGSFEDCDQKFKMEIMEAGGKRKLGELIFEKE